MLCNYKSCSSVPQIKAAGGRSIPSFIEHCTHPCTGHVEYLYNSVSSATRATTKETKQTKKKNKSFKCYSTSEETICCGIQKVTKSAARRRDRRNENRAVCFIERSTFKFRDVTSNQRVWDVLQGETQFLILLQSVQNAHRYDTKTSSHFIFYLFLNASIKSRREYTANNKN